MTKVWASFEKQSWKKRQIDDNLHDKICAGVTGPRCRCRTDQEEWADWDAYVRVNYVAPMPMPKRGWGDDGYRQVAEA